ncbi:hypothetical protein RRG08_017967 [Elysia crispata]|uniref:Nardilysin n=1 Tax=Elysia crispata TaxID=231223 RepID=A0AAE0ZCT1_9GAST|nr:hypothetical protein RRG08_017967 [Elysia crispata]
MTDFERWLKPSRALSPVPKSNLYYQTKSHRSSKLFWRMKSRRAKSDNSRATTMIEIIKPPTDYRSYRVVILPNGITAMLISEGSEDDTDMMEVDDELQEAAAALCIGVGSFSDLPEIPGFAHFLEHMVFMGSRKFPQENFWDAFLSKCGGESNAWTDCERTCFYFVCPVNSFKKAIDIFAQFFISPLFNKNSVDKEIMAVDNECRMVSSNDNERARSIISHELVEKGHPMAKFMAGNVKSLKEDPERENVNVYDKLHAFYKRMYSAHYMTLVVHSIESLDAMEAYVVKIFSKIPNNEIPKPMFIKPPFQERSLNKLIRVVPMGDVQKMEVIWALPPLMEHYRARTIEFLSLLLGHEGKGSILSALRRKQLALDIFVGNDMTGFTHNSTWSSFMISIKLLEEGIKRYDEVLAVIYQYIYMLKQKLPAHVFEEQQHIQETKYIFNEQDSIYSYVEQLAENMHMFPPEHYLCGRTLFFEYNEQLVLDCLDFLRPQGMLVMLYNKSYSNMINMAQEPWHGARYKCQDFDAPLISKLMNLSPNPHLHVPEPNPYIVTNFALVKAKKSTLYPVVVMNEVSCRVWYKKDNNFFLPTAAIHFNLISSTLSKTCESMALSDVFLTMLLQTLTETLHNATLAGYDYSVEGTPEGIMFIVGGYSEKIKTVTKDTIHALQSLEVEEEAFKSVVVHLKQVYVDSLLNPLECARAVRYSLLENKDPSIFERFEQMDELTFPMLQDYISEFYRTLFVEALVMGNLSIKDAIDIGSMLKKLVKKPLAEKDFPMPSVMELPVGDFKCLIPAINKEDTNSCVVHYFQQGLGTFLSTCLNDILSALMMEPLFNNLRTKHQLGYSVFCQPASVHAVAGFMIVVESQAHKFSMKHIDDLMNKFLADFEKTLETLPTDKVNSVIESQASLLTSEDGDLFGEASRFWQEIITGAYVFDRPDQQRQAMDLVTRERLLKWLRLMLTTDKRRKLTLMVEGCTRNNCKTTAPQTSQPLRNVNSLLKNLRTCPVNSWEPKQGEKSSGQTLGEQDYITNFCEFKTKMKILPHHVVNE